jgi:ribosomal protein S18 acetylase RimI-like enzyme
MGACEATEGLRSMSDPRIDFEPFIDEAARQFIVNGLDNFNIATFGLPTYFPSNFVLRSIRGEILGGLLGYIWGGWLWVSYLWVTEGQRGLGHGGRLLDAAEAYAHEKSCLGAALDTHNAAARAFYERRGYQIVGEIADYPPGHTRTFHQKRFA